MQIPLYTAYCTYLHLVLQLLVQIAFFLYISSFNSYGLYLGITLIGGILTTVLHPTFYRHYNINVTNNIELSDIGYNDNSSNPTNVDNNTISFRLLIISVIKYFFLILAFVSVSGLLFGLI